MKSTLWGVACLGVVLFLSTLTVALAEEKAAPTKGETPPPREGAPSAKSQATEEAPPGAALPAAIGMVELPLEGKKVVGRVIFEDEQTIRVEPFGAGVIGYRKDVMGAIRRFTLSREAYYAEYGDYYHDRAWSVEDALAEFNKARQAYGKALAYAASDEERARLKTKLDSVLADQDAWQTEAIRKADVEKARQQAELVKLERQMTEEKLAAFRRQDQTIRELQTAMAEMQRRTQFLLNTMQDVDRRIQALERNLAMIDRVNAAFLDLRQSLIDLKARVDRLEHPIPR